VLYILGHINLIMSTNRLQNSKYQSCIDACNACAESCELCATSCLREEEVKMLSRCIQLDRDCATVCWTASQLMSRDSEYVKQICNICAELCDACAEECERHQHMEHCKLCAQACRKCAEECRKMVR
jgi:hypothetical protein